MLYNIKLNGILMSFKNKLLEKSNSFKFYKDNLEKEKLSNEALIEKISNLEKEKLSNELLINELEKENIELDNFKKQYESLVKRCKRDYLYFDVDSLLSKFCCNPYLAYPFDTQAKWILAFMDHLAKKLELNVLDSSEPFVSIIFPVYNYEDYILKSIEDVLNQTYSNFELIIIDDASDDNTQSLIKSLDDDRIRLMVNDTHKGLSYSRNVALDKAVGDYIFYLDMNHSWQKRYLKSMVGAFMELPDSQAIYSGNYLFNKNKLSAIIFGVYNKALLYNKNYISLSAFAHKKEVLNKIKFDESMDFLEDWAYVISISKNFKMYSIPILQSIYYYNKSINPDSPYFTNQHHKKSQIKAFHDKIGKKYSDFSKKYILNKKISIIIPSYEIIDDLKECIETILSFELDLVEIIVVDNNSNQNVREYLKSLSDENKIKYIQNDINYGFTYAVEQGISISDEGSDILIFNNDAVLTKGALEAMQFYAYELKDCGLVVPQQFMYGGDERINYSSPFADNTFETDFTISRSYVNLINMPLYHDGEILELSFAPFFCVYIKRDVYNKTLGLDSELGRHYASDRIFSYYIRHVLKLKIYHTSDAKVYHKTQSSTKKLEENEDEYDIMFKKNKWDENLAKKLGYENPIWKD